MEDRYLDELLTVQQDTVFKAMPMDILEMGVDNKHLFEEYWIVQAQSLPAEKITVY